MPEETNGGELCLLLANGQGEAIEAMNEDDVLGAPQPEDHRSEPSNLGDPGADPNDLRAQRWGLVVPKGKKEWFQDAVGKLAEARAEQQEAPVRVYEAIPGLDEKDSLTWYDRIYAPEGSVESELPDYLLVLGDLDEISLELQQVLAAKGRKVGRLALPSAEGYSAYCDKVLRYEREPLEHDKPRALFYTVQDRSKAVKLGYRHMVSAIAKLAEQHAGTREFDAREVLDLAPPDVAPDLDKLLAAAGDARGDLLFTLSHGVGDAGWDLETQRRMQGAMCFPGTPLTGEDIAARPFVPGGFWFFFACFGAGTPSHSVFSHWLEKAGASSRTARKVLKTLAKDGPGFVAALPQAALANPDGPLGVIGHFDLAWTYSFLDKTGTHADDFRKALRQVVGEPRVGLGQSALGTALTDANARLTYMYDENERMAAIGEEGTDSRELGSAWMRRQDLAGFALLGDPAVRLPRKSAGVERRQDGPIEVWEDPPRIRPAGGGGAAALAESLDEPADFGVVEDLKEAGARIRAALDKLAQEVATKVEHAAKDAASLDVRTFVTSSEDPVEWDFGEGRFAGKAELVAWTHLAIDGDRDTCFPVGADGKLRDDLCELHLDMVEQAQQHRAELLESLLSVAGKLANLPGAE